MHPTVKDRFAGEHEVAALAADLLQSNEVNAGLLPTDGRLEKG